MTRTAPRRRPRARVLGVALGGWLVAALGGALLAPAPAPAEEPAPEPSVPVPPVDPDPEEDAPELPQAEIDEPPPEDDLLSIFHRALEADRQLAAARGRRRAAGEELPQARALFLPELTGALGYEDERQDRDGTDFDTSGWDATLSLTQPLYRRESFARLEQAYARMDAADLELALTEQQLVLRVAEAYFAVLLAQDEQALVEAELAAVESELERAKRALEVGTGTTTDVDEAQARYDQVLAEQVAVMNQLDVAREELRRITGRYPGRLAGLVDDFEPQPMDPPDVEHWVRLAERYNLEVQLAEREDRIARHEIDANRAERWPEVELEGRLSRFDGEQPFAGPAGVPATTEDVTVDTRSIRLQMTVPLYTGGATSSRIRAAEAERTALSEELVDQRREGALNARSAFLTQRATRERVSALEQAVRSARSNERSVRRGQEVGLRTTTDVLDAQQRRFQTLRDLAEARYDYLLNTLELQAAAGHALDEAAVEAINRQLQRPER